MRPWLPESFDSEGEITKISQRDSLRLGAEELYHSHAKVREEAFLSGYKDGLEEGRKHGTEIAKQEGFDEGRAEGLRVGYQVGYDEAIKRIEPLGIRLHELIDVVANIPLELQPLLTEWVYETALHISGKEFMDISWFEGAVKEALGGLPRPGEQFFLRVSQQDVDAWHALLLKGTGASSSRPTEVIVDTELQVGQAYIEIRGMRIDIGSDARRALVRNALGMKLPALHSAG